MADKLELAAKDDAATAERLSAGNLPADWYDTAASEGEILLRHPVRVKNIWIPCGREKSREE